MGAIPRVARASQPWAVEMEPLRGNAWPAAIVGQPHECFWSEPFNDGPGNLVQECLWCFARRIVPWVITTSDGTEAL
jgi:hypothetical protein